MYLKTEARFRFAANVTAYVCLTHLEILKMAVTVPEISFRSLYACPVLAQLLIITSVSYSARWLSTSPGKRSLRNWKESLNDLIFYCFSPMIFFSRLWYQGQVSREPLEARETNFVSLRHFRGKAFSCDPFV